MPVVPAEDSPVRLAPVAHAPDSIILENIGVRYRVPEERITSLKEYALRWLSRGVAYREFWALQGASLAVKRGEAVGIIGPNGAGKSTLLKVVARVLHPTTGRVRVWGKVAPLLELGAGFNPELTGRENVFLNSAVLGFSRRDIAARFDRIVEFAGVGPFIDMPLRTYSTGMVARLGFAVATDVPPEILIVDEVLAVGDAEFRKKSAERLAAFRDSGATVLVVSHNLPSINELCQRAIWLEHGQLQAAGPAEEVTALYQAHQSN
jgi:ABC-type polysaccharide/polyol phosphate transport system ATPase subunit